MGGEIGFVAVVDRCSSVFDAFAGHVGGFHIGVDGSEVLYLYRRRWRLVKAYSSKDIEAPHILGVAM